MIAYKGFNEDMTCRDMQYTEGETYEMPDPEMCVRGFHACKNPVSTFYYYTPDRSVYHEVEIKDVKTDKDLDKVCAGEVTVRKRLTLEDLISTQKELAESYEYENCPVRRYGPYEAHVVDAKAEMNSAILAEAPDSIVIGGRDSWVETHLRGISIGKDGSKAESGDRGISVIQGTYPDVGTAITGDYGTAVGKFKAVSGKCGVSVSSTTAVTGAYGRAVGDKYARAGEAGVALTQIDGYAGERGVAISVGFSSGILSGEMGAMLVFIDKQERICQSIVIDGKYYKPNTKYQMLRSGRIVECDDDEEEEKSVEW